MGRKGRVLADDSRRAVYEVRRVREALVVEGIGQPADTRTIQPHEFGSLRVDDTTYQRMRTSLVNELIYVIKNGGRIFGRVAIAKRPDGSLWIVDGLQRFMAALECGVSIPADLYTSEGPQAEALLYQALNNRRNLAADNIVKSHQGPGAHMLMERVRTEGDPYYGNVSLGVGKRPYSAFILIKAMLAATTGLLPNGKAGQVCSRLDFALRNDPTAKARAEAILRLIPLVFPAIHPMKLLPAVALGLVAANRWQKVVVFPGPKTYEGLKRINWDTLFETASARFLPSVKAAIEKRWREEDTRGADV